MHGEIRTEKYITAYVRMYLFKRLLHGNTSAGTKSHLIGT